MRKRIILGIIVFLILGVTAKMGYTTSIGWNGLPDLVIKSDIIASGTISIKDGKTVLITDQVLKGEAPKELTLIVNTNQYMEGAVNFIDNENVLLFLKTIDASSAYLTAGDLAKWPRADWLRKYPDILNQASPESIAGLVKEILRIESTTDINERVGILRSLLDSSDSLLNLIALQYAVNNHIWSQKPYPDDQAVVARDSILEQLSSYALRLVQGDIQSIQEESIRFLQYADPKQALPILISKITASNTRIRASTHSVLKTFMIELKTGEGFNYNSNDSDEKLLTIQRKWQEWYEANFNR